MQLPEKAYSPNNCVGELKDKGQRVQVTISNSVLKERSTLYADDEDDLRLIVDAALRFWAAREIDYKWYPRTYLPWGKDTFYRFDVLGTNFRGGKARAKAGNLEPGDIVLLVRESDNPRDENAIRVTTVDGTTIGYVPARRCFDVASMVDKVGIAIVEANNLYDDEPITVLFAFENCELERLDWNKIGEPQPRLCITGDNPIRDKYFDVQGRFKTLGSKSKAIRYLEDFGGVPYWHYRKDVTPQIVVVGDDSQQNIYEELAAKKATDPNLRVMSETEFAALIEEYQPGFLAKQAKVKAKPKKQTTKDISNARSYISKTLKKVEAAEGNLDFLRKGLKERLDLLVAANEPIGDELLFRLDAVGVSL